MAPSMASTGGVGPSRQGGVAARCDGVDAGHLARPGTAGPVAARKRYPPRVTTQQTPHPTSVRRALRAAARGAALTSAGLAVLVVAAPATADVPEGWSNPEEVDVLQALLVLAGIPLLLFVLITLAVYLPAMIRGERLTPDHGRPDSVWFGGPRDGSRELAGPDDSTSEAGGARGRW
jgi:hypothetical protein